MALETRFRHPQRLDVSKRFGSLIVDQPVVGFAVGVIAQGVQRFELVFVGSIGGFARLDVGIVDDDAAAAVGEFLRNNLRRNHTVHIVGTVFVSNELALVHLHEIPNRIHLGGQHMR